MSPEQPILELLSPPRTYTASDLVHWADAGGELDPHWREFLSALACQQQAAAGQLEADLGRLQAMSEEFRYQRDITTAEETELWLNRQQVDLDSFSAWLERRYWLGAIENPARPEPQPFAEAEAGLQGLFFEDAVFSDAFNQLGRSFGRRLVAHYHPSPGAAPGAGDLETARRHFLQSRRRDPAAVPGWLDALGRDALWLEEMILLEASYLAERNRCFTPARKAEALRGLRLPLTRFELEWIEFSDADTAREAVFCLRESGQRMPAFAAEAGFACRETAHFAEELPEALRQRLLSAAVGEVLEPGPPEEGCRVCRVAGKQEPSLEHPAVNARLEERLLDAVFAERFHQHLRMPPAPL